MSKKTNYNSIVFLTTLSVYLGLVLVGGAASPALAQAAMTRDFDIKNEIEFKDNLDNKPDEDLFAQTLVELVKNLDSLSDKKSFDWEAKSTFVMDEFGVCESDDSIPFKLTRYLGVGSTNIEPDSRTLEIFNAFDKANAEIARKLFTKTSKPGFKECYSSDTETAVSKVSIENKTFHFEIEISSKNGKIAHSFADLIGRYLSQSVSSAKTQAQKIVVENTKSKVDDTKILLVTHLPRASIDELLNPKVAN